MKHTSLALHLPRREVEWTRFDQSAGHVKPFNWYCYHCSGVFLLLSDGELRNSGVVRGGKEGMVSHPAWHLEFLRDLAEATGKIERL